jgi:hypothetical protein
MGLVPPGACVDWFGPTTVRRPGNSRDLRSRADIWNTVDSYLVLNEVTVHDRRSPPAAHLCSHLSPGSPGRSARAAGCGAGAWGSWPPGPVERTLPTVPQVGLLAVWSSRPRWTCDRLARAGYVPFLGHASVTAVTERRRRYARRSAPPVIAEDRSSEEDPGSYSCHFPPYKPYTPRYCDNSRLKG